MIGIKEYIRQVVDRAPPLTADQRARLALLLRDRPESKKKAKAA